MMEIDEASLRALSRLATAASFSDEAFDDLTRIAYEVLSQKADDAALTEAETLKELESSIVKDTFAGLLTFAMQATRAALDSKAVASQLEDIRWDERRRARLVELHSKAAPGIRHALSLTRTGQPRLVDIDWRLDYVVKSDRMDKMDEPIYTVKLVLEHPGGRLEDFIFSANLQELTDFVEKLRDVTKSIQRFTKS